MGKQPNKKKKVTKIKKPSIIENRIPKKSLRNMLLLTVSLFTKVKRPENIILIVDGGKTYDQFETFALAETAAKKDGIYPKDVPVNR